MNMQDLTLDGSKTGTTGFTTGTTCTKTGLYKATDGKIEVVQYIRKDTKFPAFGGGDGKKKCTWYSLSSTDSSKTSFESVLVAEGTI